MKKFNLYFIVILLSFIISSELPAQFPIHFKKDPIAILQNDNKSNNNIKKIYPESTGLNIKIVESQSLNPGHKMDTIWRFIAQGMGHNATIVPQSIYNDTSFFASTDILIISSGAMSLPFNAPDIIKSFLMRKKNVYIQSECAATYNTTNLAFSSIVNDLGGSFLWDTLGTGNLAPIQILGTLSTTPNNVPSISFFWYGFSGSGNSTIEKFMLYQNKYYGFVFTPPNTNYGIMITNTDQDWVNECTSIPLMQNILYKLSLITGVKKIETIIPEKFSLSQNYPNPFNPTTNIRYDIPKNGFVNLVVFDILGREVETLVNEKQNVGTYEATFNASQYPSGVYFYRLTTNGFSVVKKMMLIK